MRLPSLHNCNGLVTVSAQVRKLCYRNAKKRPRMAASFSNVPFVRGADYAAFAATSTVLILLYSMLKLTP